VAAERQLGFANPAQRFFMSLGSLPDNDPWRRAAATEQWLAEPTETPPPKEITRCATVADRPRLDGILDEPFWQTLHLLQIGEPIGRGSQQQRGESAPAATARLGRDDAFLYIAISCPKQEGITYAVDESPRPRDADLAAQDRVTLRIDTDRDYTTYFELTVDHRGWTHDVAWSDAKWDPAWYVAAASDSVAWTIEAAVRLAELAASAPQSRDVWAIGVRRTIPRFGAISWPHRQQMDNSPEQYGLLIFD
jgi:hypothetical protein